MNGNDSHRVCTNSNAMKLKPGLRYIKLTFPNILQLSFASQ